MYYSEDIVEEVRSRNDIVDVIGSYVNLNKKGNSYMACCPFHHEKTPSFHVSRDKQMYHCFGCGVGGNVYTFIMEYENMSFTEAMHYLAERSGVELPKEDMSADKRARENYKTGLKAINRAAAVYFHYLLMNTEHGKKALDYLHGRGFSDDTIKSFGMGYSDIYSNDLYKYLRNKGYEDRQLKDSGLVDFYESKGAVDKFWNRVMVPIADINGKVIAFGGRVLGDGEPKYMNTRETEIFDKGRNLFAMNIARRSKKRGIIICEGYMDVIAMHQAGFDNAVASLGTALTMGQASLIKRYTDEVYLAYDSDGAGTKASLRNVSTLREVGLSTRVIDMKPYKDPDEFIHNLGKAAYEQRIADAVTGIIFEVDTISGGYNLRDPEDKVRFSKEAAARIATIEETVARHSYIDAVAERYGLDRDGFKAMVSRYGAVSAGASPPLYDVQKNNDRGSNTVQDEDRPQRLLLTWLVNEPRLFKCLDGIISEDDFVGETYHAVAEVLFGQYRDTGMVKPAAIVDMFDDIDKQRLVAAMLQTELPFDMSQEDKDRAINDIVRKTKLDSIDYGLSVCGDDMNRFQELVLQKARVSKMNISLKNG